MEKETQFSMSKEKAKQIKAVVALANNLIMKSNFSGDDILEAADAMRACHAIYEFLGKELEEENGSEAES
jgi:hypothetical protein